MKKRFLYILSGIIAFFVFIIVIIPTSKNSSNVQDDFNNQNQEIAESSELKLEDQEDLSPEERNDISDSFGQQNQEIKQKKDPDPEAENKNAIQAENPDETKTSGPSTEVEKFYPVVSVVDGDTIKISIDNETVTLRLIGIDTPETVDPRKPVQCFGVEASNKAIELLSGKKVRIEKDSTQGDLDKYGRTLAYVFLEDGTFYNKYMIENGYAHEYTYDLPYKYQAEFKKAQKEAQDKKLGLWSPDTCNGDTSKESPPASTQSIAPNDSESSSCTIKGNINSKGEKIYHMIGCGSYTRTVIDESKGERWFCTEQEAIEAGWRKALNCN